MHRLFKFLWGAWVWLCLVPAGLFCLAATIAIGVQFIGWPLTVAAFAVFCGGVTAWMLSGEGV